MNSGGCLEASRRFRRENVSWELSRCFSMSWRTRRSKVTGLLAMLAPGSTNLLQYLVEGGSLDWKERCSEALGVVCWRCTVQRGDQVRVGTGSGRLLRNGSRASVPALRFLFPTVHTLSISLIFLKNITYGFTYSPGSTCEFTRKFGYQMLHWENTPRT